METEIARQRDAGARVARSDDRWPGRGLDSNHLQLRRVRVTLRKVSFRSKTFPRCRPDPPATRRARWPAISKWPARRRRQSHGRRAQPTPAPDDQPAELRAFRERIDLEIGAPAGTRAIRRPHPRSRSLRNTTTPATWPAGRQRVRAIRERFARSTSPAAAKSSPSSRRSTPPHSRSPSASAKT